MTTRGRTRDPKWDPQIVEKTGSKMDPNMISLRIGHTQLSGVGARPCRRKCWGSRKGKGNRKYVAENEVRYEQEEDRDVQSKGE